jgi:AraC-like DNA-binding protein
MTDSYVELPPRPGLAGLVRTVWIQQTGDRPYVQHHLPTGGMEIHFPIGGAPQLVGPLTGPLVEVVPPRSTLVGVRFLPGAAPPLWEQVEELVDQRLDLKELWGSLADELGDVVVAAPSARAALNLLQDHLAASYGRAGGGDQLVLEAVRRLMPWQPVGVASVADELSISSAQLRRRCLSTLGVTPKALQRTLRFQGFLALAQAGAAPTGRRNADGLSGLAVDVGYADQAHLTRECVRLTGQTPRELLHGAVDHCACGHDHVASYRPFLATRETFNPVRDANV